MRTKAKCSIIAVFSGLVLWVSAGVAAADSCWTHNGSMMRLQAQGENRWLSYQSPRQGMWNAEVQRGTLLFNGRKHGDWYSGLSRVFSGACPGSPLEYYVEGPVLQNPLRIVLRGTREMANNCRGTGRMTSDELVFVYSHRC